jgi:integrase
MNRPLTRLSVEDVARALAASTGETRVIVEVLYAAGPRVSEVVKLRWADVNLAGREVRLQGKGGGERGGSNGGKVGAMTMTEVYVDFRGWRWHPPFRCLCCGIEVDARQWAYGRCCPRCDTGACDSRSTSFKVEYAHEHPEWWIPEWALDRGQAMTDRAAEITGAERLP